MTILSLLSFAVLATYVVGMAWRKGIPAMLSDTYYQLQPHGYLFSIVLSLATMLVMVPVLDSGLGIQCFAFLGLAGLLFVAFAPNYLTAEQLPIHKGGAVTAAVGCTLWAMSVTPWPTLIIATAYILYLIATDIVRFADEMWHVQSATPTFHPWYWAELAAMANLYATFWVGMS